MPAFLSSLIWYTIKFVFLIAVMVAAVVCGKKFRDLKDAKNAAPSAAETKE